ncbi:MAG: hypothetical protein ACOYVD_11665 [Bacillota bacterium]
MYNHVLAGAISGIITGIIMGLISMALFASKICKLCIIAIGGGIFTGQLMDEFNGYGILLSWLTHLAISGALGILIQIMLYYLGEKLYILKGAGLLTLVYLANIGVIAPLRGVFPNNQEFNDLLLILIYHIFFGSLASFLVVKYKNKILI